MTSQLTSAPRRATASLGRRSRRTKLIAIAASVPAIAFVVAFFGVPVVQAVRISLSDWQGFGAIDFTGFGQYVDQLTSPELYQSLLTTLEFSIAGTVGIMVVATLLAAAVSRRVAGAPFYRVIWFIPGVAPAAAVAVYWNTSFQPRIGTVNALLGAVGLPSNSAPLASTDTALGPVIWVSIWAGVGFAFILILGAMEQIPVSLYEAAQLDGASTARQFLSITLPLARPVLAITATLNLIWSFNNFSTVWGMTNGGPGLATTTLPLLVYRDAFTQGDYGAATAVAVIAGAILLVLGFVSLRLSQSRRGA